MAREGRATTDALEESRIGDGYAAINRASNRDYLYKRRGGIADHRARAARNRRHDPVERCQTRGKLVRLPDPLAARVRQLSQAAQARPQHAPAGVIAAGMLKVHRFRQAGHWWRPVGRWSMRGAATYGNRSS